MKSKGLIVGLAIGGVLIIGIILLVMWGISVYNNLVAAEQNVLKQWSQVENQYQRRADLIPNLVNTVKGYANFEKEVLTQVTEARARVGQFTVTPEVLNDPQAFEKFQSVQGDLSSALSRLLAVVENYPELKANENFLQLQAQLEGTENRISVERKRFNEAVQEYNTMIKRFPASMLAGMFGFHEKQYFKAVQGAEVPPKVEF
ncbi:MAG: LemA family protein [Ignavibacterium sp.]|jgi:LemA protein|uniref:LemA family protein n=1 Tax=Ignavibacterium album TaxID=591197 RepID=A0A7V3E6W2_9BACT|nr:LemA family protein [Ignavibacterium album]MCA2005284.1 LemA family protein [Ignavibacterium sp.]MCX8107116.1 LemA family protein [Ignavibacterium album]